jgi:methylenetetrahydrofolate dehydrogenase (NADP+)/methenyltetrahydrofolate cyclohydrolase
MKIDGKAIAEEIFEELKKRVKKLQKEKIYPKLAIILVGTDPASLAYINQKEIKAKLMGTKTEMKPFPVNTSTSVLLKEIKKLNEDKKIHGIIVQQPLPKHVDVKKIINMIDPKKDVDGFHPDSHFQMPIVMAVLKILEKVYTSNPEIQNRFIEWLKNKKIVAMGKGETGGKPVAQMFKKMKVAYDLIDSKTKNPEKITITADIIISAVGKPNILKPEMIKAGVILIGIGISRGKSAKLMGDYDQNEVKNIASFYTPTPGGIGPVNVAMLLKNTIAAAEKKF